MKTMKRTLNTLGKSMFITIVGVSMIASSALAADMGTTILIKVVSDTTTEVAPSTNSSNTN
ncbi:hypothetical protein GC098_30095 [Paenibacillus sp. LMG 31458]|uniref:Uncharacterized protein n=1 Tax=Paenibacillus phytorum TaxID=2654977 RepID=A0ABX1Y548_9BACL|nr:hypothetical protein [Paenibacillus phytorum]NOU75579.1 hypothetical protein [Paenibacillus phytorum]